MKTCARWFAVVGLCGAGVLACGREGDSDVGAGGTDAGSDGGAAGTTGAADAGGIGGTAGGDPDGSAGTAAGMGGSSGAEPDAAPDAPACNCGPREECWNGQLCVAKMVEVPGGYAIDATEVTEGQYRAWLATKPLRSGQPDYCAWNLWYDLGLWCYDASPPPQPCQGDCDDHPAGCLDWCDAYAYCKAVGKRLCGKIGGGANEWDSYADAASSQWYNACSSGGSSAYPYGDAFSLFACNDTGNDVTVPVGTMPHCQSTVPGFEGVFDLSGNLAEWEDSCWLESWDGDPCRIRGGAVGYSVDQVACAWDFNLGRSMTHPAVGFRCCRP